MAEVKTKSKKKAPAALKFDKKDYIEWYESMYLMRKFEEKCGQLYIQQKFGGFCHLYIGQEAILAGMKTAMADEDRVITAYRDHAHPLVLGTPAKYVMAELYGKRTGLSKGKGGSMHMFDVDRGLFGGHGIVGAQIPMGAGMAFADKYKGNDNVTVTFFGDGAARQGALHETFNMAMTWKLPVIFVVENNQYAMGTSVERTSNVQELWKLGLSYEMPSEPVDGMSPENVAQTMSKAFAHCRSGKGPYFLEIKTYRYKGHSMSDPQKYRSKEEVATFKDQDPITHVLDVIKKKKYLTEAGIKKIQDKVKKEVEESVKFAEESPQPEAHELYEDVYSHSDYPYVKG
ncbi:MAG: pyruvate dehydrogenase E1 component alpha subunit [Patiriisocius sp.]|jgi:pyruvate dehydrogenase E1 component alpha subunit